eukprot:gb/GECG01013079.1/.p1 GENE.gb/GECG01013079.1/~~gb/GECG01013079.1/.p1  ORF type:complete len:181 (+),score=11.80 gb/GECG01013079.1/:1-543(+)
MRHQAMGIRSDSPEPAPSPLTSEVFRLGSQGKLGALRSILEWDPSLAHSRWQDKSSLIHAACECPKPVFITLALIREFGVYCGEPDEVSPARNVTVLRQLPLVLGNATLKAGWTPVHIAARQGHAKLVRVLIEEGKSPVDHQDDYGDTPLHQAAQANRSTVVRRLCKKYHANAAMRNNVR